MKNRVIAVSVLLVTFHILTAGCAATVSAERIDKLVVDLASEKYRVREAADSKLRNLLHTDRRSLQAIVPHLLAHLNATADPEVATRLERMLGPVAFAGEQWEAEFLYLDGLDLYRQGYLKKAVKELRTALRINPQHDRAKRLLYNAIWLITEHEQPDEITIGRSIKMEQAIQAALKELKALSDSGRKLMEEEKYDLAKERFERCVEIIRWFPYYLHSDQRYTDAIAECDRRQEIAGE